MGLAGECCPGAMHQVESTRLRTLVHELVSASSHKARSSEHSVFDRLLYKNRSQHRNAPYFRRLEHVRRTLRSVRTNPVWGVLENTFGTSAVASSDVPFSTMVVSDIETLVGHLRALSTEQIPRAAQLVMVQLVSRGYFVPFSIGVIACLGRLYAMESVLQRKANAVLVEMQTLMMQSGDGQPADEDTGECIGENDKHNLANESCPIRCLESDIVQARPNAQASILHNEPATINVPTAAFCEATTADRPSTSSAPSSLYGLLGVDASGASKPPVILKRRPATAAGRAPGELEEGVAHGAVSLHDTAPVEVSRSSREPGPIRGGSDGASTVGDEKPGLSTELKHNTASSAQYRPRNVHSVTNRRSSKRRKKTHERNTSDIDDIFGAL